MVGTVLSGFEYRAQKEKYDRLYKFLTITKTNINILDLKKAINKTQNVGYQMSISTLLIFQEILKNIVNIMNL